MQEEKEETKSGKKGEGEKQKGRGYKRKVLLITPKKEIQEKEREIDEEKGYRKGRYL